MKAEKSGGRTESLKMLTVQCTICGMDIGLPGIDALRRAGTSLKGIDLLAEGYGQEELKM